MFFIWLARGCCNNKVKNQQEERNHIELSCIIFYNEGLNMVKISIYLPSCEVSSSSFHRETGLDLGSSELTAIVL